MLITLALQSLRDRKSSIMLSIIAMTVSIFVLLGVEHIRHQTKESFSNTVSGVDLIVGARTGSLNLLLYSVFKIGNPTNNMSWEAFNNIADNPKVKWAIPLSLGDSHKGFRVLGTTQDYFKYFSYGKKHRLLFKEGQEFDHIFDVVLGDHVAKKLGYTLGDELFISHGIAKNSFSLHDNTPYTVVGILAPTGTPVDHTLHVNLNSIEVIHNNWQRPSHNHSHNTLHQHSLQKLKPKISSDQHLQPESITAAMVGLKSKISTFKLQREINNNTQEPLLAILPGVALSELWQMMKVLENTLLLVSILVLIAACLGVSAMLLSSIRERTREIQLLRMIGASPTFLFLLVAIEALFITIVSIMFGATILFISLLCSESYLSTRFGLHISTNILTLNSLYLVGTVLLAAILIAIIPSVMSYKRSKYKNI